MLNNRKDICCELRGRAIDSSRYCGRVDSLYQGFAAEINAAFNNNYQVLQQVKQKYDPSNVFWFNHNITPAE